MAGLDPEDDVAQGDNASSNASTGKFQKAWDQWTSKPENNAALLQFGLSMLQPHAPGQSAIGAAANSVAQGGEAAGRVLANQQAADTAEANTADKESQAAARTANSTAALKNADAYSRSVDNAAANGAGRGTSGALKIQADFRKWLAKSEDTTGLTTDPIVGAISKKFPDVKTKADLLNNPQALRAAQALFAQQMADPAATEDSASPATPATPPSPPQGTPRTIYGKNGKPYTWDGIPGSQPVPQ